MATAAQERKTTITKADAEALLCLEARLIDDWQLEEWLELFTEDALYWIPIDDQKSVDENLSHIWDDAKKREERVYHLLHVRFPAQAPRSRTVHVIGSVEVEPDGAETLVRSAQIMWELRTGDHKQVGLGELRPLVARVEHRHQWSRIEQHVSHPSPARAGRERAQLPAPVMAANLIGQRVALHGIGVDRDRSNERREASPGSGGIFRHSGTQIRVKCFTHDVRRRNTALFRLLAKGTSKLP